MADKIRATIEKFIPDLLAYQKKEIFTAEDVKQIIKAREQNEYLLHRKNLRLKDFLKVVEYEYQLERRRLQQHQDLKLKKSTDSDYSSITYHKKKKKVVKRIIQLWDKITNKYRYNVGLWKQYLCFCFQIKSKKQFNKAVTNALRYLPYEIDLWLLGAYYEFEVEQNPFKARKIFYKALRLLGTKPEIWQEYLSFEMKFLQQVKNRENYLNQALERGKKSTLDDGFVSFRQNVGDSEDIDEDAMELENKSSSTHIIESIINIGQKKFQDHKFKKMISQVLSKSDDRTLLDLRDKILDEAMTSLEQQFQVCQVKEFGELANDYLDMLIQRNGQDFKQAVSVVIDLISQINHKGKGQQFIRSYLEFLDKRIGLVSSQEDLVGVVNEIFTITEVESYESLIKVLVSSENDKLYSSIVKKMLQNLKQIPTGQRYQVVGMLIKLSKNKNQTLKDYLLEDLQHLKRSASQVSKQDIYAYLDLIINSNLKLTNEQMSNIYDLGKQQLLSNQSLLSQFLESVNNHHPDIIKVKLGELVALNQYCPIQFHLQHVEHLPPNKQWIQLQMMIQWFGQKPEAWQALFNFVAQNVPERGPEMLEQGLRDGGLDNLRLTEIYNLAFQHFTLDKVPRQPIRFHEF